MVRLLVDPNQVQSSSEFGDILSPVALRRLQSSWQFLSVLRYHVLRYQARTRHLFFVCCPP